MFSTGSNIDSCSVKGSVVLSPTLKPVNNIWVGLYNFLDKENFYLKMERTLLETKFGEGKVNDIFNHLKKKISNEIIESYESRNLPIDFTFTGNKNKVVPAPIAGQSRPPSPIIVGIKGGAVCALN